jgi:DNA-binding transcriptional regulator YdaS (Cro superfamily)
MRPRAIRTDHGLELAIATAGSVSLLAERLGITPQTVCQWARVPAERALEVERITGVSRHFLRPDIYPDPPSKSRGRLGNGVQAAA